jgi:hypothetical protein
MIRRYNLSHPAGQPMPEDWLDLPDSVVAAADYDALAARLAELETRTDAYQQSIADRVQLQARLTEAEAVLRDARSSIPGHAKFTLRRIDAFLVPAVSAVQPERCCLDYPRCDCNSPPEPDSAPAEWSYARVMCREDLPVSAEAGIVADLYNELLYAVESKYPGESRHDTALRYIRDRETRPHHGPSQTVEPNL